MGISSNPPTPDHHLVPTDHSTQAATHPGMVNDRRNFDALVPTTNTRPPQEAPAVDDLGRTPPHGVKEESYSAPHDELRAGPPYATLSQPYPPPFQNVVSDQCNFDMPIPITNTYLCIGNGSRR